MNTLSGHTDNSPHLDISAELKKFLGYDYRSVIKLKLGGGFEDQFFSFQ